MLHRPKGKETPSSIPGPTYMSNEQVGNYLRDLRNNRQARPTGARPLPTSSISTWRSKANASPSPASPTLSSPTAPASTSEPPRSQSALSHRDLSSNSGQKSLAARASVFGRPLVRDPIARAHSRSSTRAEQPERSSSRFSHRTSNSVNENKLAYRESGQRWMERQEAHSLRRALEDMDVQEEQKLYTDARDEAAELVWKHQNPSAAFKNPDAPYEYTAHLRKNSHARAQSIDSQPESGRNSSVGSRGSSISSTKVTESAIAASPEARKKTFSAAETERPKLVTKNSSGSTKSHVTFDIPPPPEKRRSSSSSSKRRPSGSLSENPKDKIHEEPEEPTPVEATPAEATPAEAGPSETIEKKPGPQTKIPIHSRRNPFSRIQFSRDNLSRSNTDPLDAKKKFDRFEIHRNPPTQSRNPAYTSSNYDNLEPSQKPLGSPLKSPGSPLKSPGSPLKSPASPPKSESESEDVKMKEGKEIRGDDIRAATSMKLKDRSPKLPTPTMVSDSRSRPIVSFQQGYKPKEIELKEEVSRAPLPSINLPDEDPKPKSYPPKPDNGPRPLPEINVPDKPLRGGPIPPIPTINAPDSPSVPSINVQSNPEPPSINVTPSCGASSRPLPTINAPSSSSTRPLPTINAPSSSARPLPNPNPNPKAATRPQPGRPNPRHTVTTPNIHDGSHWTPANVRSSALCAHCALPISGRIVSAAGSRFHPECFTCHNCGEGLECVAFYPEPDARRAERLARIEKRQRGEDIEVPEEYVGREHELDADDGNDSPRFYCHLDFHEFFSPRCKSCKTPIEGEVIVACGAEWHVGHFFCAECGDPFDSSTPFVEKDGYAWCVNCHTNRYSTKCKKCRKPVTETVLKALGQEWHPNCFVCMECSGPFEDGRYFLRGPTKDPVCVKCEEMRLKA
ncbi:uncharacterized protein K452DRAFT_264893 [Aplosporella prunicola CBS 121167]|uniref:LIM zinc-binding domain-containing protein n=1 Tax=Aplosporella prunicola CBS 121167 TaxID=1176127 RepID=A0A6A6BPM2_9PEZI|nr:uncharacterized protein K452DRAFT_264893 [Aplosporella prunicola CBS 121167]KAF2145668.1 hypothetical protein K452DRAFT_264893 [Aplosporella prunicola CBS 121167]